MARNDTIEGIERRAAAAPHLDGILELLEAGLFIGIAIVWEAGRGELLGLLALPIILAGGALLVRAKKRITYPRIGFVEPKSPPNGSPWGGIAYIGGGLVLMVVAVVITGDLGDTASWVRWAPFLAGFLCAGGFWYTAQSSGLFRHRVLAVLSVFIGLVTSLASDGSSYRAVALYFGMMAVVLAAVGLVALVLFLSRHPRADASDT